MLRIFLLTLASLFAFASEPRVDLYKRIKKETGVSLREAFQTVDKGNRLGAVDLQRYAEKVGIGEIERPFEEEIASRTAFCKKNKSIACDETVSDLKSQLQF